MAEPKSSSSYGRGARILSIGIATTGVVTFGYFAVASHVLDEVDYKGIALLWSLMFIIVSVIYRPIEQLLSRSIAERRALGHAAHSLRTPLMLQGCFALAFLVVALLLHDYLEDDVFDGSAVLYWVLVVGVLAYAASYFARGWLAGNQQFGLYGGLVLMESVSRFMFPLAVALGIADGRRLRGARHPRRAVRVAARGAVGAAPPRPARSRRRRLPPPRPSAPAAGSRWRSSS